MNKTTTRGALLFLSCSAIGIVYFFVPVIGGQTPMVWVANIVKAALGGALPIITLLFSASLVVLCLLAKTGKYPALAKCYGSVKTWSLVVYIIGTVLGCLIYLGIGPEMLISASTGGSAIGTAGSSIITIITAGIMVPFIAEYGLLEMIGCIIEPAMRPVFKVPGCAAIDAVTSFVASQTLGVFFTNKLYMEKTYTKREASSIATGFSIISLGFFAVMADLAGAMDCYGPIVLTSFVLAFVMAAIMIRIPPLSRIPNEYYDGSLPVPSGRKEKQEENLLVRSFHTAAEKAESVNAGESFKKYTLDVVIFSQKIAPFIIVICTITLYLAKHTPVCSYLGLPFVPLLKLLGVPAAKEIAPSIILGLAEVSMPSAFLTGLDVPMAARFFVVVVSSLQILAWACCAPSIMESDLPLNAGKLLLIFLVRTLVAIVLTAGVMHLIF